MTLRDYASVVVRRKWIVIAATLIATVIAVVMSALQTPIYSASSEVLIQPRGQDGLFDDSVTNLNDRAIQTEIQVLEGQAVRLRVQENLGLDRPPAEVNVRSIGSTDVISVDVRSANANNASILANAYANAYIEIRREQSVEELLSASAEVQSAIDDLNTQIDTLADDDPSRASLVAQAANFNSTLDQLRVDARLRTGGATIIKDAITPTSPVEPTPARTATLALIVGLLLGLAAAFLIDYLDDKVRDVEDLEALTSRTILAEVPVDPPNGTKPLAITAPDHSSVESYRGLRTNLQFLALDSKLNVVQLTSSLAGEGKTTTATNLAVVLARAGHRVALVDADLRRPRVHEVFQLNASPGLTDMLLGSAPKEVVNVVDVGQDHKISVYTAGAVPSNPSEMLSGRRMNRLLTQMGNHYDFVVVDSAPILPVSDSVAVAGFVDAVIVVAHADRVTKGNVTETLERLDRVSAPVIGLVLNQTRGSKVDDYSYGGYAATGGGAALKPGKIMSDDVADDDALAADALAEDPTGETIFSEK
ncbi:MAG: polysaccharide biosynthesis tyrosine autokinase [Ilumatobacter sp.]